ncbi:MAG: invasion associated locus B family protein [Alphaproteobacteria bacterium]|nr:invasion associated locus B family protein [Alphaproteobacteria bacterium]
MNLRILTAVLAATAMAAPLAAQAQAPAPKPAARPVAPAAAAPRPAAPRPAAPAAAGKAAPRAMSAPAEAPQDQLKLIYSPWTKLCVEQDKDSKAQLCFTGKDGRIESGVSVIRALVIETQGNAEKILRLTLPLGMQLAHGTQLIIDSNTPLEKPFVICLNNGCMADYSVTPELLAALKKGQNMVVRAIDGNGALVTLPLPLAGTNGVSEFSTAFDGPPITPQKFEEDQKRLQEELQRKAEDARRKLEQPAQ